MPIFVFPKLELEHSVLHEKILKSQGCIFSRMLIENDVSKLNITAVLGNFGWERDRKDVVKLFEIRSADRTIC